MRYARTQIRNGRGTLAALLIGGFCVCNWGCHQHYYYYGASGAGSPCPPGTVSGTVLPSNVTVGPVCEVPATVEGGEPVISGRSTIVDNGRAKPKVVISQPERRSTRYGWRATNPEDVPTFTQIEGAVGGTTIK